VLVSHVTVPPAMVAILEDPDNRVQGFLAAGPRLHDHGMEEYEPLAAKYRVPIIVTGFEPLDILEGILMASGSSRPERHEVENQYVRAVRRDGNRPAQDLVSKVFRAVDRGWRGIGRYPRAASACGRSSPPSTRSGSSTSYGIRAEESAECRAGDVLRGHLKPYECPAFGKRCTPESPLGAPMVSSEGACAAYYNFGRMQAAAGA
jgi:hydrogenase expression/formation protein HypD